MYLWHILILILKLILRNKILEINFNFFYICLVITILIMLKYLDLVRGNVFTLILYDAFLYFNFNDVFKIAHLILFKSFTLYVIETKNNL